MHTSSPFLTQRFEILFSQGLPEEIDPCENFVVVFGEVFQLSLSSKKKFGVGCIDIRAAEHGGVFWIGPQKVNGTQYSLYFVCRGDTVWSVVYYVFYFCEKGVEFLPIGRASKKSAFKAIFDRLDQALVNRAAPGSIGSNVILFDVLTRRKFLCFWLAGDVC